MAAVIIQGKSNEPISTFYNNTVDLCKFSKGQIGNFMVQIFFQDLLKYSNYTLSCPLKKVNVTFVSIRFPQIFNVIAGNLCGQQFPNLCSSNSKVHCSIDADKLQSQSFCIVFC